MSSKGFMTQIAQSLICFLVNTVFIFLFNSCKRQSPCSCNRNSAILISAAKQRQKSKDLSPLSKLKLPPLVVFNLLFHSLFDGQFSWSFFEPTFVQVHISRLCALGCGWFCGRVRMSDLLIALRSGNPSFRGPLKHRAHYPFRWSFFGRRILHARIDAFAIIVAAAH